MVAYTPDQIEKLIADEAQAKNIDPSIFRRMLATESGLDQHIVNHRSGAAGIAQFMPGTAAMFKIDPLDASQAIPASALYVRTLLNKFGGDYSHALAAYNWGPGNVASKGLGAAPPETQAYVQKITGNAPIGTSYGGGGGTPETPGTPGGGQLVPSTMQAQLPPDNNPSIRLFGNDAPIPAEQPDDPNAPTLADIFIRKGMSTA